MVRLFTCVWIPENIKENIIRFQNRLKLLLMDSKFVEKENLHLTITFLGDKGGDEINHLSKELDEAVRNLKKFHVKLEGLMVIPSESYIKVIGVHVNPRREIEELIERVATQVGGDYHKGMKMTLCRVKNVKNKYEVLDFIQKNRNLSFGEFDVHSVSLVKSTMTSNGPVYETIHKSLLS